MVYVPILRLFYVFMLCFLFVLFSQVEKLMSLYKTLSALRMIYHGHSWKTKLHDN